MALRVLLADESTTIKKVMQLALQDFAVDVRTVHAGVDVIEVARQFKPDIIFADVLLQKKNGYEVSAEIKQSQHSKQIPVVLMWSSFMDLDEKLAKSSGADGRLEKPFDVESLRQLIQKLVAKTETQPLASFLDYPPGITDPLRAEVNRLQSQATQREQQNSPKPPPKSPQNTIAQPSGAQPKSGQPTQSPINTNDPRNAQPLAARPQNIPFTAAVDTSNADQQPEENTNWNMDSFEDINEFSLDDSIPEPVGGLKLVSDDDDFDKTKALSSAEFGSRSAASNDDDDGDDDFQPVRIQPKKDFSAEHSRVTDPTMSMASKTVSISTHAAASDDEDSEGWSMQEIGAFKLDLSKNELEAATPILPDNVDMNSLESDDEIGAQASIQKTTSQQKGIPSKKAPLSSTREQLADELSHELSGLNLELESVPGASAEQIQEMIRKEVGRAVEKIVREMVPEIAEKLVRRELDHLLAETAEEPHL
jgi:CheY-like chemotaxis protein